MDIYTMDDMDLDIVDATLEEIGKRLDKKWDEGLDHPTLYTTKAERKQWQAVLTKRKACIRNQKINIKKYMDVDGKINLDNLMGAMLEMTDTIEKSDCSNILK